MASDSPEPGPPASWLVENLAQLRPGASVLDVACGHGRHALFLAERGFRVHAVDRDHEALAWLRAQAGARALTITTETLDLETTPPPDLGRGRYDVIVVFNYLHRPLFPALRAALAPGGRLVYETFTAGQAERGHPKNPAFLLQPGELRRLVAPLTLLHWREGEAEGRMVASVVASA